MIHWYRARGKRFGLEEGELLMGVGRGVLSLRVRNISMRVLNGAWRC